MKKLVAISILSLFMFGIAVQAEEFTLTPKEQYIKQIISSNYEYTPLGLFGAIKDNNINCIDLFIKSGFDPNTELMQVPAIVYAIKQKNPQVVDRLLKAGVNPNLEFKGRTLMNAAIASNNAEIVNTLIKHGANVNQESWGTTPLNYAIKKKNSDMVNLLIRGGARVDEKSLSRALNSKSEIKNVVLTRYKKQ
jgi:ankyrin repeat protein